MQLLALTDAQSYLNGFAWAAENFQREHMGEQPIGTLAYARLLMTANPGSALSRGFVDGVLAAIGEAL